MSHTDLTPFFGLYGFSTGRRIFALTQVRDRAQARGIVEVVAHVDAAIEHDRATRQIDHRWAARDQPSAADAAVRPIDHSLDRSLSAVRDAALAQAAVARPGDGLAEQVDAFLSAVFPLGVSAVTSLPYVEELAAVELILEQFQGPQAAAVTELGLTRQAERVAELAADYRAALQGQHGSDLSWDDVRAARARGQELLLETVALIIALTRGATPEAAAARADLLAPILEQNEAVRRYLRARRKVEDVDPATGEEQPAPPPVAPAPEAAAAPPPA